MLLQLLLTNFLTLVVACCVGMYASAYDHHKLDYLASWVAVICVGLFVVLGYYAIWQL